MKFILGKKIGMSQVFTDQGIKVPVTVLEAGPCKVVQVKSAGKDQTNAVQLGFGKRKKLNRPAAGHQKGASFMHLRNFAVDDPAKYRVGQEFTAAQFVAGEYVIASGVMKGRGFTGPVKRHGFHGAPASHGHDHPRAVGSIGSRFPQHTLKGTRMAGRMGGHQVSVKNLFVVDVIPEKNLLLISGAVPGANNGLVKIVATGKILKNPIKVSESAAQAVESSAKVNQSSEAPVKSPVEADAAADKQPVKQEAGT